MFSFNQKICNECMQLRKEDRKVEKTATEIYKQLASTKGALIPSDDTLAAAWNMTNGAATGARSRLRSEGYDFKQRDDGYWEVTSVPDGTVTHYHANEVGVYKIHHERVTELPVSVSLGGGRNSHINKWQELQRLLENMPMMEIQRAHFTSYKLACQAQSALYGHCKRMKFPFTVASTVQPQDKTAPEYWLYFQKVAKDPAEWGKGANSGVKRQRRK